MIALYKKTFVAGSLLLAFCTSSVYATPGSDHATATANVIFSSAVKLNHNIQETASAFRVKDVFDNGMWKTVLVGQGTISVLSGKWTGADDIVVRFTPTTCTDTGISAVECSPNGQQLSGLKLTLTDSNNNVLQRRDIAGWGTLSNTQGSANYNVRIAQRTNSAPPDAGVVNYSVDAAVFEN